MLGATGTLTAEKDVPAAHVGPRCPMLLMPEGDEIADPLDEFITGELATDVLIRALRSPTHTAGGAGGKLVCEGAHAGCGGGAAGCDGKAGRGSGGRGGCDG